MQQQAKQRAFELNPHAPTRAGVVPSLFFAWLQNSRAIPVFRVNRMNYQADYCIRNQNDDRQRKKACGRSPPIGNTVNVEMRGNGVGKLRDAHNGDYKRCDCTYPCQGFGDASASRQPTAVFHGAPLCFFWPSADLYLPYRYRNMPYSRIARAGRNAFSL